jgi:hypothetical protein
VADTVNEGHRRLALLCRASAAYDGALGIPLLLAAPAVARMMGAGEPQPVINAQLNGLFALSLALGYLWAAGDVRARRGYLWVFGVFAKLAGSALFVLDHLMRGSPAAFLLFAVTDGLLGLVTLALLLASPD